MNNIHECTSVILPCHMISSFSLLALICQLRGFLYSLELEMERDKREREAWEREIRDIRELEFMEKMKQEMDLKIPGTVLLESFLGNLTRIVHFTCSLGFCTVHQTVLVSMCLHPGCVHWVCRYLLYFVSVLL